MQVISLYWLRAGYVRRLRCRRRRANAWWCRSSMRCACAAYKKQLSQGLFFAVFLILQSSERRLFSNAVFFFPTAVLGVAFSSLRREHLRDLLRSQFFFFRSAFAGALLSFLLFYLSSRVMFFSLPRRGNFCRRCESLSFFGLREGRVSVLLLVFFPSVFSRGAISFF